MTQTFHQAFTEEWDNWLRAQLGAKGMKYNQANINKFYKTVDLKELEQARGIIMEKFEPYMLKSGAKGGKQIQTFYKNSGINNWKRLQQTKLKTAIEVRQATRKALGDSFPAVKKTLTSLAVFGLLADNLAFAGSLLGAEPPHVKAAWDAFEWDYRNALRTVNSGRSLSNAKWWDLAHKFEKYLDAVEAPGGVVRTLMFKRLRELIGDPNYDSYYP